MTSTFYDFSQVQPFYIPFPNPEDVFAGTAEQAEQIAKILQPILTLNLRSFEPAIAEYGYLHVVNPVEPFEGYIGEHTTTFHNYYSRTNWLGFFLNDANKLEFLGDWRYFQAVSGFHDENQAEEFINFYNQATESFECRREYFLKHGHLAPIDTLADLETPEQNPIKLTFLESWHARPGGGNWAFSDSAIPLSSDNDEDFYPVTEDGRRFHFIATIAGSNYRNYGAEILVFFDPLTRIVLFTFDWS